MNISIVEGDIVLISWTGTNRAQVFVHLLEPINIRCLESVEWNVEMEWWKKRDFKTVLAIV